MRYNEDNYEDELDRMRARKQGKRSGQAFVSKEVDEDDFSFYDDVDEIGPAIKHRSNNTREKLYSGSAKKRRKKRLGLKIFLAAVVFLIGYLLFQRVTDDGYWTIAVFGVDSRDGRLGKGALSDVEMVCSINKKTGEMRLVSVFRDTYLRIDDKDNYHKINEAYFKGGHQQAVAALEQNLDLKIDDYATFNWKAVVDAINVLGGVDIEITDREFAYINGFITETVNSTGIGSYQLDHSGMNHLDGVQAVAYARLRLMDTDFNRTERQRKVLSLAMEKAKAADFNTLKTLIGAVFPQISTSIGVDDLIVMAKDSRKYYIGQTSGFPFSHTEMKIGKMDCVIPTTLESNVTQLHNLLYDDDSYTPSGTVKKISSHISEKSGIGEPGKDVESNRTNSGQSSGSSSSGSQKPAVTNPAPQETPPPETESVEESMEETTESESIEETTIAPIEESTEESTEASTEEPGPGTTTTEAQTEPASSPVTTAPTEEQQPATGALEGPGQGNNMEESVGPGIS